jgi:predicted nucleic acid-binding protein
MYSKDEHEKRKQAVEQINEYDRFISTQILNKFCNVCIRKLNLESNFYEVYQLIPRDAFLIKKC